MHGDRQRQRAKRDHVVHNHRDRILRDVIVKRTRGHEAIHRVGNEVLRAQPFFDVGQITLGCLDEIRAFAAARLDFRDTEAADRISGGSAGELRAPLERVERAVVDARTRVGHAFHELA